MHFVNFAHQRLQCFCLNCSLLFLQHRQSPALLFFRHGVRHHGSRRFWSRRIFERKHSVVFHFVQQRKGLLEIFFSFTGKSHNHIGCNCSAPISCSSLLPARGPP